MRKKKLIKKIINAIQLPGEDNSDGECLDEVIEIIEKAGYDFKWEEYYERERNRYGYKLLPVCTDKRL